MLSPNNWRSSWRRWIDRNRRGQRRGHGKCVGYGGPFWWWRGVDYFCVKDAHFCCARDVFRFFFRFLKGVCVSAEVVMTKRGREDRFFYRVGSVRFFCVDRGLSWGWKKAFPHVGPTLQITDHSQRNYDRIHRTHQGRAHTPRAAPQIKTYDTTPKSHYSHDAINQSNIYMTRDSCSLDWPRKQMRSGIQKINLHAKDIFFEQSLSKINPKIKI